MGKANFDFTGERYAVTGASSGMGRLTALELARSGAEVLAIGRDITRLDSLKDEFPERIFTASLDVCDSSALEEAVSGFTTQHGKLNGGVHAAGVSGIMPFRNYDREHAEEIMNVNFWAGMELLKLITRSKFGLSGTSTVIFSSVASVSPTKGMFAYSASKAAVDAAIRSVSREIASKHHRVNSILPGWVITTMTDSLSTTADVQSILSRYSLGAGRPEDVIPMVMFLLSDSSRWITGTSIFVDGGGGLAFLDYLSQIADN